MAVNVCLISINQEIAAAQCTRMGSRTNTFKTQVGNSQISKKIFRPYTSTDCTFGLIFVRCQFLSLALSADLPMRTSDAFVVTSETEFHAALADVYRLPFTYISAVE